LLLLTASRHTITVTVTVTGNVHESQDTHSHGKNVKQSPPPFLTS